jgi:hypothetical protein
MNVYIFEHAPMEMGTFKMTRRDTTHGSLPSTLAATLFSGTTRFSLT